jgi:hypothetical protein
MAKKTKDSLGDEMERLQESRLRTPGSSSDSSSRNTDINNLLANNQVRGSDYDEDVEKRTGRPPGEPDFGPPKSKSTNTDGAESDDDIGEQENEAASKTGSSSSSKAQSSEKNRAEKQIGDGYVNEGKAAAGEKTPGEKAKASKKKKKFILGGAAALGVGLAMVAALSFLSLLKLPQLIANIETYEFARLGRNFSDATADITGEKLTLDASEEAGSYAATLKDTYGSFRSSTWGKLDKFRPQKILNNMQADGQLKYLTEPVQSRLFPGITRDVLAGVSIDGDQILLNKGKWYNYFTNRTGRLEFSGELTARLEASLQDTGTIIRGGVAKDIRDQLGVKLRRWERLTKTYRDAKTAKAAEIKATAEDTETVPSDTTEVAAITDAESQARKVGADCLKDEVCLEQAAATDAGSIQSETAKVIASSLGTGVIEKAVGTLSTIYSVALPACIIWEGSVEKSGPTADASTNRAEKTFYTLASAAHQQKSGQVSAQQVGALNQEVGDTSNAPSELKAGGKTVDAQFYTNPEASQTQSYTLADALFGHGALGFVFDHVLSPSCPYVTDLRTAGVLAAAETAAKLIPGEGEGLQGAEIAATEVITPIVDTAVTNAAKSTVFKKIAKGVVRDAILITGGTLLAKFIVLSRMGNMQSTIPSSTDLQVQAHQGGIAHANDLDRKQFYGRSMTRPEVAESNYQDLQDIAFQNSRKSVFERYFSPTNPTSMLANMAVSFNNNFQASFVNILHSWFSSLGSIFHPSSSIFTGLLPGSQHKALAASVDTEFNMVQFGWTNEEQNMIRNNPNYYSPINNAQIWERQSADTQTKIKKKYDKCFTDSIGTLLANKDIVRDSDGHIVADQGDCAPNNLTVPANPEAFAYRVYMRNQAALDQMNAIQNPTADVPAAGAATPADPSAPTPPATPPVVPPAAGGDSTNIPCAAGRDLGAVDGWRSGKLTRIRVCNVQGTVINSQVSKQVDDMYTAAHAANVRMGGGGFRYMDGSPGQIQIYHSHCAGDGITPSPGPYPVLKADGSNGATTCPGAAGPGFSNHQMGFAIDITCGGALMSRTTPAPGTNACFDWLGAHAHTYGFQEYGSGAAGTSSGAPSSSTTRGSAGYEAWHWSIDGN